MQPPPTPPSPPSVVATAPPASPPPAASDTDDGDGDAAALRFEALVWFVSQQGVQMSNPADGQAYGEFRPDNGTKLKMYGLFKQANEGDNRRRQPGVFNVEARAKDSGPHK